MPLSSKEIISLLKSIGNNLLLGKGFECSLFSSIKTLPGKNGDKDFILRKINFGENKDVIIKELMSLTEDISLARIWSLISNFSELSTTEAGEKILSIAENLEKNTIMIANRNKLIRAQKYKIVFLGTTTSIFLGIIAALAPLFSSYISMIRNIEVSTAAIYLIPFSLFVISCVSTYFLYDIVKGEFDYRILLFSSIVYIAIFFITKLLMKFIF